ncbi:hypothetical protein DRW41_06955 [Neobacillus piezotolerans]|uniref:Lipopolysaccharide biosynthesis protein n=1 Tax=Neobacillus piezotolerans TaxID=2259171 RepID=A0A3D8GSY4_9BACI|nr:hypothetical protein [Neobacillus piezotolerans]RDU37573.1 hypothetical protein DRW41_06955 [Neobacillus piezotolerans]
MAEEKKYILYEYLSYFWKRKWLFVIIPLATAVLIAAAVYILKPDSRGYTAEGTVFTGSVNQKELTDPDIIEAKYQDVKGLSILVPERDKVKFKVKAKSQTEAEKVLDQVRNQYFSDLKKNAQLRIDLTTRQFESLQKRMETLDSNLALYEKRLAASDDTYDQEGYRELIGKSMDERYRASERADKKEGDIALFSNPEILPAEVHKAKTYIPESLAIGIILGLILAVALLALMKYLSDARRFYKEKGSFLD